MMTLGCYAADAPIDMERRTLCWKTLRRQLEKIFTTNGAEFVG